MQTPKVGDVVIFCDTKGRDHPALVVVVWGSQEYPAINLAYVSSDENEKDPYGRQIKRSSSVGHASVIKAHGNYWRFPEEERNPYAPPTAV